MICINRHAIYLEGTFTIKNSTDELTFKKEYLFSLNYSIQFMYTNIAI